MDIIFPKILHISIQISIVLIVVIACRILMRRLPKKYTYLIWLVVAFRLLCPISLKTNFSIFNLFPAKSVVVSETTSTRALYSVRIQPSHILGGGHKLVYYSNPTVPEAPSEGLEFINILTVIWLVGIVAILIFNLYKYGRLQRLLRDSKLLRDNIYESDLISSPCVIGVIRPKIYIPVNLSEKEYEYMIAHEQTHIYYRDYLNKVIGLVLVSVHWFNPLIWIAFALYCTDIEIRCDEVVIDKLGNSIKRDYCKSLVSMAAAESERKYSVLSLGFSGTTVSNIEIKNRVKNILSYKETSQIVILVSISLLSIIALSCATNATTTDTPVLKKYVEETEETRPESIVVSYNDGNKAIYSKAVYDEYTLIIKEKPTLLYEYASEYVYAYNDYISVFDHENKTEYRYWALKVSNTNDESSAFSRRIAILNSEEFFRYKNNLHSGVVFEKTSYGYHGYYEVSESSGEEYEYYEDTGVLIADTVG